MNPLENNEMKTQIDTMLSGLNGMVSILEKNILKHKNNLTPDQAKEFAEQMKDSDINGVIEKYKNVSKDLKRELNID